MKEKILIKIAEGPSDLDHVYAIRREVFVTEQGVPLDHERDEIDNRALHVLAWVDGEAVGTARTFSRPEDPDEAWIGRMAVRRMARKKGIASRILEFLVTRCRERGFKRIRLHSQKYVAGLYRRHGFVSIGAPFQEEGIEHLEMVLVSGPPTETQPRS